MMGVTLGPFQDPVQDEGHSPVEERVVEHGACLPSRHSTIVDDMEATDTCELCDRPAVTTGFIVVRAGIFEARVPLCEDHATDALAEDPR